MDDEELDQYIRGVNDLRGKGLSNSDADALVKRAQSYKTTSKKKINPKVASSLKTAHSSMLFARNQGLFVGKKAKDMTVDDKAESLAIWSNNTILVNQYHETIKDKPPDEYAKLMDAFVQDEILGPIKENTAAQTVSAIFTSVTFEELEEAARTEKSIRLEIKSEGGEVPEGAVLVQGKTINGKPAFELPNGDFWTP